LANASRQLGKAGTLATSVATTEGMSAHPGIGSCCIALHGITAVDRAWVAIVDGGLLVRALLHPDDETSSPSAVKRRFLAEEADVP
jgi:hypothetical protein